MSPSSNPPASSSTPQSVPPRNAVAASSPSHSESAPPEDTPENIRVRGLVVLSFWAVVILLGVPLWWATTSIYRAPLPLREMQRWADGSACRAEFPLLVDVEAPSLPEPQHLLKTIQHALDDANDFSAHHLRLRLSPGGPEQGSPSSGVAGGTSEQGEDGENVAAILKLIPGPSGSSHTYKLSNSSRVIEVYYSPSYNPSSSASSAILSAFIAGTLQEIFAEEQQVISHLLSSASQTVAHPSPSSGANGRSSASKVSTTEITRKMSRVMRYSPTYHLTFSLFTASGSPASWEIEEAISEYLQPLLDALSGISNFTVDSQIQFYASFSPNVVPTYEEDSGRWILRKEDLGSFINSAEWPLASITSYPTINFIIYIPSPSQSPLSIASSTTNSFLLPQWGGVLVFNPPSPTPSPKNGNEVASVQYERLTKEALKPSLDIFAAQLLSLLGAPSHPPSLPIRLDSLTRQRSAELLVSASSTLGSLYRLTLALPSISIPSSVSTAVSSTLRSLTNACAELKNGRFGGVGGALEEGRNAAAQAEKAFFEKSMVGQVYFPDEHKVAVYLPLLGPVGVPLIMAGVKELARVFRARKEAWKRR